MKKNILLSNKTLEMFIKEVNISQDKKDFLLEKLPQLDLEERMALFKTLTQIYLLDLEEEKVKERIKKFWQE